MWLGTLSSAQYDPHHMEQYLVNIDIDHQNQIYKKSFHWSFFLLVPKICNSYILFPSRYLLDSGSAFYLRQFTFLQTFPQNGFFFASYLRLNFTPGFLLYKKKRIENESSRIRDAA